jgi:hypothetical protein
MRKKKHQDLPERSDPDYSKLYYKKQKEKVKKVQKKYLRRRYEENPNIWKGKYDSEKAFEYRQKNIKIFKERDWKNRGIIDITYEIYLKELEKQDGKCKICNKIMDKVYVDHDHITGNYRGLLCRKCNCGLGYYEKYKDEYVTYLLEIS